MSAMSNMEIDANEDLRWQFIDAAVALLEKMTDREVTSEIDG